MPRATLHRDLLAPPADVWAFVAEPHNFPDWWPGVAAVEPDRRGAVPGARWRVQPSEAGWTRGRGAAELLVVHAVEPRRRFSFELTGRRLRADLVLTPGGGGTTRAHLTVQRPWLTGSPRTLVADALNRLHALCQTGAEP